MPSRRALLLFLLALVLRLLTQGWDSGLLDSHPDERTVATHSGELEGWFDDPEHYAYGALHYQAVAVAAACYPGEHRYAALYRGGRLLSLLATMIAIGLGWVMVRRAWGQRSAELFLLLMAWVPLDIQQSHFITVEAHHSAWVVAALAACFWLACRRSGLAAAVAGATFGASLAIKVASLALVIPLAAALLIASRSRNWLHAIELAAIATATAATAFWLGQPSAFVDLRPPLVLIAAAATTAVAARLAADRDRRLRILYLGAAVTLAIGVAVLVAATSPTDIGGASAAVLGDLVTPLSSSYLRGVGEQITMVMGHSDLPYVRVYRHTLPFLYPLRELGRWGLGPLLLLAVIGGAAAAGWWSLRRWRRLLEGRWTASSTLLVVLLAWLLPMTVRLSTLEVKYLRYWQPLVVPGVMIAAWALLRLPRPWRRRAVWATAAGTVLWGLSYLWSFATPHPHLTASDWLQMVAAEDEVVAFEHWDETIKLPKNPKIDLPSYELPDDEAKLRLWLEHLEDADWVVFTSNRVWRSVFANPERYPRTGRLYKLLLAGEAGFEPLTRVERGPRFFGLRRPVQLADESFLNYDLPRVVIFRRVGPVDVEELLAASGRPLPYLERLGPGGVDRLLVQTLPALPPIPTARSQAVELLAWLVMFVVMGAASWVLLLPLLRAWPDAGVGLALVTGWLAPAWLLWLGSELGAWPVGEVTATWVMLALAVAGGIAGWRRRLVLGRLWRTRRRAILLVLAVAAAVWLLFLSIRASNPAIYWGEKPMDFSFLNAFLRAEAWPTDEPWLAGAPLHYYYFGEVLASVPILITGTNPAVGYNLMSATIPALGAGLLAAVGLALARRRALVSAAVLPLVVLLTGNLYWLWPKMLDLARQSRWFDLWWATSRVLPEPAIDEYPLWTSLFADLHGHFIALPVMLACLVWGWHAVQLPDRRWLAAAALCGVSAAVLVATNPWDVFLLVAALGVGSLVAARRPLESIGRLALAGAASVAAALPFIVELAAGIGAGAGGRFFHLTDVQFATASSIIAHLGQFLLPAALLAVAALVTRRSRLTVAVLVVALILIAVAAAHAPVAAGYDRAVDGLGEALSRLEQLLPDGSQAVVGAPLEALRFVTDVLFGSSASVLALALLLLFAAAMLRAEDRALRLAWGMAALAMAAVLSCERFTLIDRMNTLFKVYNGVWVLSAFALGVMLLRERGQRRQLLVAVWVPLQLVALYNLPLGIFQGFVQPRIASPRPTLDGQAFLPLSDPESWFAVRALQGVARPADVVAESFRDAYSGWTRIAMHTGQPIVAGWPHHLKQRGQPEREILARYADLETLYAGADPAARRAVLDRYRVRWVVLANLERRTYDIRDDQPFLSVPGVRLLAEREGSAVYAVRPSETAALPLPVTSAGRQRLPEGLHAIGSVPVIRTTVVRGLGLDDAGGSVVLRDGSLLDLDPLGQPTAGAVSAPCRVISVARRAGVVWVGCPDGAVWGLQGSTWRRLGTVPGEPRLTRGDRLWAWTGRGLWRHGGDGDWQLVEELRLTAAAASGANLAISDGEQVWVMRGSARRQVASTLPGVRALAWQGSTLWALTDDGLYLSGGALLAWRQALADLDQVSAMAGSGERLWLVLADGRLVERSPEPCRSPWQGHGAGGALDQPRDVAVSADGWFAVSDTQHDRVAWFTLRGSCLDSIGGEGAVPGSFQEPSGLALAPDGTLAVADTWNGRIQLLRPDGVVQVVGKGLYGPRGVLWLPDGALLVADTGNMRLLRYRPPDWTVEELFAFDAPVVGLELVDDRVAAALPAAGVVVMLSTGDWSETGRLTVPGWEGGEQQEGYLVLLPSGELLASAPGPGELWRLDPQGVEPARRLPVDLPGVGGIAMLPDGDVLASQITEHRLVRVPIEPSRELGE